MCYVEGFKVVGEMASSGVFRQLSQARQQASPPEQLLGAAALKRLALLLKGPRPKNQERIMETTLEEQARGWLGPFRIEEELNHR